MNLTVTIEKLTKKYGTCNPFLICQRIGIIVVFHPLGDETRGLIKKYKRSHIICINSDLDELEQLKTCAHELGHYVLHKNINTLFMSNHTYFKTDVYEFEADNFADILLTSLFESP